MQITPTPTPEEAAAIAAVFAVVSAAAASNNAVGENRDDTLHVWVESSRRTAQRAGMQRGPWRLSGRIARRARA